MGEETVRVDPNEDLETLIARLKQSRSKDVVLELPTKQRALQTLDNFYALRKAAREDALTLTFSGGNKTLRGLAKLLGFGVRGTEDGDEADFADFAGGATDQITMPPMNQAQPRTQTFDGPPQGFVQQQAASAPPRNGNGNGRGEAVPPPITSAEDFFSSLQDVDIPSIQPPPARNDNGFGTGGGDQVLNRNNAANIFGMPGGATSGPPPASPPPPRAEFDFSGGGSGEGSTLTYEEAMRQGFLADQPPNLSDDFQFDPPNQPPPLMDDDDVPPVPPVGGDNAAAQFRRGGRRNEEEFDEPISRSGRSGRNNRAPKPARAPRSGGRGLAMPPALASLGRRVNKVLNPVEVTNTGGMRSELTPAQRAERRQQSRRTTFFAFIALAVLLIAVILIIVLSLLNSGNNGTPLFPPNNPVARLNLVYKTQPVNNNATLLLDTSATAGTSGSAGQTNPAGGGNAAAGAGTGGRLPVSQISTGAITAKSDYPAFGSKMQPTGTAQGNVTFINAAAAPIGFGAGTVLFTGANGVSYRLRDGISIPAGNPLGGTQGRANGVVVADKAGSVGNLPNGFSRYLSNTVAVVTNGAVTGGTEQPVKVVSPADLDGLKKLLLDKVQADAQSSLQGKYNPATEDIVVVPGGDPQCTMSKQAGEVADTFSGSCTVNPQVYRYSKTDLQKAVQDQLVTDPKLRLDPGSIKIGGGANVNNANGRITLQVPVSGQAYTPVDLEKLKQDLANKPVAEAQTLVSTGYPGIDRIDFSNVKDGKLPEASKIEFVTTPGDTTTSGSGAIVTPAGTTTAGAGGAAPTLGGGAVLPTATPKP